MTQIQLNTDRYEHRKREDVFPKEERKRRKKKAPKTQARLDAERGRFNFKTINGFKLIDVEYSVPDKATRKRRRKGFNSVREKFLAHIAKNCQKELRAIGITDKQIEQMKKGSVPNGYNVHHKLPIHGGGLNEFSNLILMPIPPHDELHHKVLDPQVSQMQAGETKKVKLPWSDNMVYVPPEHDNTRDQDKKKTIEMIPYVKTMTAARR
ncbi:putative uncharacterized protein [Acetobacter sp. CAG:977]|nr:putative uncharacterized protein [Acetobacter sp. CAG:977]